MAALKTVLLPGLKPNRMRETLLMRPRDVAQLQLLDVFTLRHDELVSTLTGKVEQVRKAGFWQGATIGVLALTGLLDGVL